MTTTEIFKTMVDWIVDNTEMRNPTEALRKAGLDTANYSKIKSGTNKSVKYETMQKLNNAFGRPFNPEWMRGRSDKMLSADIAPLCSGKHGETATTDWAGVALAPKDETIAALKRQLGGKDETIAAKDSQLADRDRIIATKDALISNLQQTVGDLRARLSMEKGLLATGRSRSEPAEQQPAL